jgi:hypothetical protein
MQDALGKITVTVPGQPVRATNNRADPAEPYHVHAYTVQRRDTSSGKIYVQLVGADDRTSELHTLAELTKSTPAWGAGISNQGNVINMADVWIDADVPGDSVLISVLEF